MESKRRFRRTLHGKIVKLQSGTEKPHDSLEELFKKNGISDLDKVLLQHTEDRFPGIDDDSLTTEDASGAKAGNPPKDKPVEFMVPKVRPQPIRSSLSPFDQLLQCQYNAEKWPDSFPKITKHNVVSEIDKFLLEHTEDRFPGSDDDSLTTEDASGAKAGNPPKEKPVELTVPKVQPQPIRSSLSPFDQLLQCQYNAEKWPDSFPKITKHNVVSEIDKFLLEHTEDIPALTAKQNLEAAKIEPKKSQKTEKKTTQAPTTAEDIPAPPVKRPKPAPTKQLPPPNPVACYPVVRRLIPRGMKSAKTDSLDETLKKDKTAMTESFVVSAGKQCLKSDESDVLRKMEASYPKNIQHIVLPSEVKLLCLPVSKMFAKIESMAQVSELKLSTAGCEFDDRGCILSVSDDARQLLKSKTTDATTVYFAFGAEFHEHITDECDFSEASIPLLYVIALQTRFSEASRRKACAVLRRKLVKVLGYFKAADRAKMPFPINIVEAACKLPEYSYDPTGIKTDSESDQKKMQNGDGKRKK